MSASNNSVYSIILLADIVNISCNIIKLKYNTHTVRIISCEKILNEIAIGTAGKRREIGRKR